MLIYSVIYFPANPSASPSISSATTSSSDAAVTSHASNRSSNSFYNHIFTTHIPKICTVSSQSSRIGRISMYYAAILYLLSTHASTSSNPNSCIAVSKGGYYQLTYRNRRGYLPLIHIATLCLKPPMTCPMRGVITHISDPK